MEDSALASNATVLEDTTVEKNSRLGWVEKHAELIAKLEAEYQRPQGVADETLTDRYFCFTSAGLNLLIPNHLSSQVLEQSSIHPIPLAPTWLLGACNVRGDIVPVIDLEQIIKNKKPTSDFKNCSILILDNAENSVGILIDELPIAIQFKQEQKVSKYRKIPNLIKPFVSFAYSRNHTLWVCVNFKALISSFSNE